MKMLRIKNQLEKDVYNGLFGVPDETTFINSEGIQGLQGMTNRSLFKIKKTVSVVEIGRDLQDTITDLKNNAAFRKNLSDLLNAQKEQVKCEKVHKYEEAINLRDKVIPALKAKVADQLGLSLHGINKISLGN